LGSSESELVDGFVHGYWEYEGKWQESLLSVLDEISFGCGLNKSYVMMSASDGSSLVQKVQSGQCRSLALNVSWNQAQMSQFDPASSSSILSILNSFPGQRFPDVAWMPVLDRWFLDANYFANPELTAADAATAIKNLNAASNGSVAVSVYSLLGFDDATFSKSIPITGKGVFGGFPSPGGARPRVAPFSA